MKVRCTRGEWRVVSLKEGKCVYLSNHRAWADFFIDMYITEGRAFILSRFLVVYVFPMFAVPAMINGAVFAFKRNKPGAHEELNKQLDAHLKNYTDFSGFVLYPEGQGFSTRVTHFFVFFLNPLRFTNTLHRGSSLRPVLVSVTLVNICVARKTGGRV